jgi:predicted Rdx family selenoprotein
MKLITSLTRAKTRRGLLQFIRGLNSWMTKDVMQALYDDATLVAIHVHKYTGAVVFYEAANGTLIRERTSKQDNIIPFSKAA